MNGITIKIGNREVGFCINSAIIYLYKESFGTEYLVDLQQIVADHTKEQVNLCLQPMYRIIWCMAKLYDSSIPPIIDWLSQFPYGDFKVREVFEQLKPIIEKDFKVDRKNV